jgi:hypothetical protein
MKRSKHGSNWKRTNERKKKATRSSARSSARRARDSSVRGRLRAVYILVLEIKKSLGKKIPIKKREKNNIKDSKRATKEGWTRKRSLSSFNTTSWRFLDCNWAEKRTESDQSRMTCGHNKRAQSSMAVRGVNRGHV